LSQHRQGQSPNHSWQCTTGHGFQSALSGS
jgi:hypothetical protein